MKVGWLLYLPGNINTTIHTGYSADNTRWHSLGYRRSSLRLVIYTYALSSYCDSDLQSWIHLMSLNNTHCICLHRYLHISSVCAFTKKTHTNVRSCNSAHTVKCVSIYSMEYIFFCGFAGFFLIKKKKFISRQVRKASSQWHFCEKPQSKCFYVYSYFLLGPFTNLFEWSR